jgi:hypothetical protein
MRTITTTINAYQFDELTDQAKSNAVERLWDINVDYGWWESTYEDAKNVGLIINSFDIDRGSYVNANFTHSGIDTAERIINSHGEHCDTYKMATELIKEVAVIKAKNLDEYEEENEIEELEEEFLKVISEEYRIILSKEYEYLTSEDAIIETIEANEYEFTEDGNLI